MKRIVQRNLLKLVGLTPFLIIIICPIFVKAQDEFIKLNADIEVSGVPPIPKSLANDVRRYSFIFGTPLAGWAPDKREIWTKSISSHTVISSIKAPGETSKTHKFISIPGIYDIYIQPQARYLIYNQDKDGTEKYQMYLYDMQNGKTALLSDGAGRDTEFVWSNSGEQVAYSSTAGGKGVSLYLITPLKPESKRLLIKSDDNYLKAYSWSPDDKLLAYCEFKSLESSKLWVINLETGAKTLLSGQSNNESYYTDPQISKDGKGVYVITNYRSEVSRIEYIDLITKRHKFLNADEKWGVEEFQISPDGKQIAFLTNEDGISRLYLYDIATKRKKAISDLPLGVMSNLKWNNASTDCAFNFKSSNAPNDVYSVSVATGTVERWVKSFSNKMDLDQFPKPELIRWKSFDGRTISGFMYQPPRQYSGKRPVMIYLHGGPNDQVRPEFIYADNYLVNDLGIVRIYPNFRGSTGYGKTFEKLDNGFHREDSIKDIGALLDWIKSQPYLDPERVLVHGASYGGFLALSVAIRYGDRIRASIVEYGISEWISFISNPDINVSFRDIWRAEYGDERDPKVRDYLVRLSPLNSIKQNQRPIFLLHGSKDPRVPIQQAEAIVSEMRQTHVPVWCFFGKNEGHGFRNFYIWEARTLAIILFTKEYLIG
jgi:dipeptidyl aminopeptidase/acylaminoacyl peptidase